MTVIQLIQSQPKHYAMDGPDKLKIKLELPDAQTRLQAARGLLAALHEVTPPQYEGALWRTQRSSGLKTAPAPRPSTCV